MTFHHRCLDLKQTKPISDQMCQSIGLVFALIAVGGGQALRAQAQNVPISDQMCPHNIGLVFALLLVGGGHAQQAPLRCIGCTRSVTLGLRSPLWICFNKMQKGQKWQFGDLVFSFLSGSGYCVLKSYIIGVCLEGWCYNLVFSIDLVIRRCIWLGGVMILIWCFPAILVQQQTQPAMERTLG